MSNKPSQLPWKVSQYPNTRFKHLFQISGNDKEDLVVEEISKANAELIVTSVNQHAFLVRTLKRVRDEAKRGMKVHEYNIAQDALDTINQGE